MNLSREAVRAQFGNIKTLAAIGSATAAAIIGGPLVSNAVAKTSTGGQRTAGVPHRSVPLESLPSLQEQTVVQMVEQKPQAFYNGEVVLHLRQRVGAPKGTCIEVGKRCVSRFIDNYTASYYNPLLVPRTKSANLNNPAGGDFAIGSIVEEPNDGDVNGGGPPNYCAAYIDKPNVTLVASNVGASDPSLGTGWAHQSVPKVTGVTLSPNNVFEPSVEYVTFPLDGNGGLEYGVPTNPLTGQVYLDPTTSDACVLSVADDAFTN